jgi:hypothetical protein
LDAYELIFLILLAVTSNLQIFERYPSHFCPSLSPSFSYLIVKHLRYSDDSLINGLYIPYLSPRPPSKNYAMFFSFPKNFKISIDLK